MDLFKLCVSCAVVCSSVASAQPGTWFGHNVVFMFSEDDQVFKSTCICYQIEHGSSPNHMKFKLKSKGIKYDLCHEGYYLANVTADTTVCKPCPEETYSPYYNACPYCLVCRTCADNEQEVDTCKRAKDRTCMCAVGQMCDPISTTVVGSMTTTTTPIYLTTTTQDLTTTQYLTTTSKQSSTAEEVTDISTQHSTNQCNNLCDICNTPEEKWKVLFIVVCVLVGPIGLLLLIIVCVLWKINSQQKNTTTGKPGIRRKSTPIEIDDKVVLNQRGYQSVPTTIDYSIHATTKTPRIQETRLIELNCTPTIKSDDEVNQRDNMESVPTTINHSLIHATTETPRIQETRLIRRASTPIESDDEATKVQKQRERLIRRLVKKVGPDDLTDIGILLGFLKSEIDTMKKNNPGDIQEAYWSMFTKVCQKYMYSEDIYPTFIDAFVECGRQDLVSEVKSEADKYGQAINLQRSINQENADRPTISRHETDNFIAQE